MALGLKKGLIISCQAEADSPFDKTEIICAYAKAAALGEAVGVRIRGIELIKAVHQTVSIPIIGITKDRYQDGSVLITGTDEDIDHIVSAGADILAMDGTKRIRPNGKTGPQMIERTKKRHTIPIMADISTVDEGIQAIASGADFIGTTLSGYTEYSHARSIYEPDFILIETLCRTFPGRVIAEGRFWTPEQAAKAFELGAYAVVVGTAITRPIEIVKRWVNLAIRR
jgi:N-acylglucosamine-6-phosphate 2-epimerase